MERILITGSNGFVGSFLTAEFTEKFHVTGLDTNEDKNNLTNFIKADITNSIELATALQSHTFDFVIHCAALSHNNFSEELLYKVNVDGTRYLCQYFENKPIKKFIFFSSITVYGEYGNNGFILEDAPHLPNTRYGKSKSMAEEVLVKSSLSYVILRFPAIYTDAIYNDIQKRILLKRFFGINLAVVLGNGHQKHTFCYIKNIPNALEAIINTKSIFANGAFHVADDYQISTRGILVYCRKKAMENGDGKISVFRFPCWLFKFILFMLALIFRNKKMELKTVYWKVCKNNQYSIDRINKIGFKSLSLFSKINF